MELIGILKITAKQAPIPTIIALIIYFVFPAIIETKPNETVLIVVAMLVFFISLALLAYSAYNKDNKSSSISNNSIANVEAGSGDVFIGTKGVDGIGNKIEKNTIEAASSSSGDIFIGTKK